MTTISLRLRLGLMASALVLLGTAVVGFLALNRAEEVLYEHEFLDLGNDTSLAGRKLINPVRDLQKDVLIISNRPSIREAAAAILDGATRESLDGCREALEDYLGGDNLCVEALLVLLEDDRSWMVESTARGDRGGAADRPGGRSRTVERSSRRLGKRRLPRPSAAGRAEGIRAASGSRLVLRGTGAGSCRGPPGTLWRSQRPGSRWFQR